MQKPLMPFYMVIVIGSVSVIAFMMALMAKVTADNTTARVTGQQVLSVQTAETE